MFILSPEDIVRVGHIDRQRVIFGMRHWLLFVFNVPTHRIDDVKTTLDTYAKGLPVYLDTIGVFERMNPNLPRLSQMRTFMLDRKDTVVLVGNPMHNSRVAEMMWGMMKTTNLTPTYEAHDTNNYY